MISDLWSMNIRKAIHRMKRKCCASLEIRDLLIPYFFILMRTISSVISAHFYLNLLN